VGAAPCPKEWGGEKKASFLPRYDIKGIEGKGEKEEEAFLSPGQNRPLAGIGGRKGGKTMFPSSSSKRERGGKKKRKTPVPPSHHDTEISHRLPAAMLEKKKNPWAYHPGKEEKKKKSPVVPRLIETKRKKGKDGQQSAPASREWEKEGRPLPLPR